MKKNNRLKWLAITLIVLLAGAGGCQRMEIVKIIGYIQGHVFDGTTNMPLDEVSVSWSVAGRRDSLTAGSTEGYVINDLPPGTYSVWFAKTNYTTVVAEIIIENTELSTTTVRGGDNKKQIETYDAVLYPLSASLKGRLYRNENGVNLPVAGAPVQLDYNQALAGGSNERQTSFVPYQYETTTDDDGYFTFTNVPATYAYLRIPEYSGSNGEVYYDPMANTPQSRRVLLNANSTRVVENIYLTRVGDPMRLINTNLWSSVNVATSNFSVSSPITLTFNKPVDSVKTFQDGYVDLIQTLTTFPVSVQVAVEGNTITLTPEGNLSSNSSYFVNFSVYSAMENDYISSSITFTTESGDAVPAQVTNFMLDMGAGWTADYNTTSIQFVLDKVPGASWYEIYARDNHNNTEFVLVEVTGQPDDYLALDQVTAYPNLPNQFDYFANDGWQTPFNYGTEVTFKVRAVNDAGYGMFSDEIKVRDETPMLSSQFEISFLNSISGYPDTPGDTIYYDLNILNGSYADTTAMPVVKLLDAALNDITGNAVTFEWVNHQLGRIMAIAPEQSGYLVIEVSGVTDSSGNMDPSIKKNYTH